MEEGVYELQNLEEYKIHQKKLDIFKKWIENWSSNKKQKYIILTGPSGCGKTLLVKLLFKKFNYELVEFTPSHNFTHKNEVKRLLQVITSKNILSLIGGNQKAVLFDDIEVGNSGDRGYLNDILTMLEKMAENNIYGSPAIFTMSGKLKYKKIQAIEKVAYLIELDSPSHYEIFQIARYVSNKMSLNLQDFRLQFLSNNTQGDLRKLYQAFRIHKFQQKKKISTDKIIDLDYIYNINKNNDGIKNLSESWNILSKKDLEFSPLKSIETYLNPKKDVDFWVYQQIFDSEPIFTPANIYDNSWKILENIHFGNSHIREKEYENILNSICCWANMENKYSDPNSYSGYEYRACVGIAKPMYLLRNSRTNYPYSHYHLKTSNLFSRISQSSFNWKSISELSNRLDISRNQYHTFSYILTKFIANNNIDLENLGKFLYRQNIKPGDLDRIIRYNCISKQLEKVVLTKRKTIVRKILNGKTKSNKSTKSNKLAKSNKSTKTKHENL